MAVQIGDTLPEASFVEMGADGPKTVALSDLTAKGRIVLVGMPGAFTNTCSDAHVPSFIRTIDALKAKGVAEVCVIAVNDVFVLQKWGEATGATAAGIRLLGDADSSFTKAIGLEFSAPPVGFVDRSKRYTMVVEDGRVTLLNIDENAGVCEISAGETLLNQI